MLTFNIATFFEKIRPFFGNTLTQGQVQNMKVLLGLGATEVNSLEAMAYVLATVRHEAGVAMAPIAEIGRGKGHPYGGKVDMNHKPYTTPDQVYYGRGHVQLTWRCNYLELGTLVGADLLNNPEWMLTVQVSAHVAIMGMVKGSFTGRKLDQYFTASQQDPIQARHIINGVRPGQTLPDQAERIAGYYDHFLAALQAAHHTALPPNPQVSVVVGTPAQVASTAETLAAAPNLVADGNAAASGLVAAVVVAAPAPAAEQLLATPSMVAEVSTSAPASANIDTQV